MLRNSVLYFMEVARTGSMRSASVSLGVAQSAVSRQIQTLEYEMGTALIERYTNGTRLTPAGEALFRSARSASFRIDRLRSEIDDSIGRLEGRLKVAIVESLTSYVFPRAMANFRVAFPHVGFVVDVCTSGDVVASVVNDDVDFGVCLNAKPSAYIDVVAALPEALFAIVPEGHALAASASLALPDLLGHRLAISTTTAGLGQMLQAAAAESDLYLDVSVETNSLELIRQFVGCGSGIAVMTRQSCIAGVLESDFQAIPLLDHRIGNVTSTVIVAAGRTLPLPAERFKDAIVAELHQVVIGGDPRNPGF